MSEPSTATETVTDPPVAAPADDLAEARIGVFVDTEYRRVVTTVSLWAGSTDDATEAVTDALGSAWERLDRGATIDNLAAWVTRSAMNRIRSMHRHRAVTRRKSHLLVVDTSADTTNRSATDVDLHRALGELTERQRQVVALYYGLDLPVAAVAADLGIAPGTVKATLAQARDRLAALLRPTTPPEGGSDD